MALIAILAAAAGGFYAGVRFGDKVKAFIADAKAKRKIGE